MPRAELTLDVPSTTWIGELSREFPEATFRILAAVPGEEEGVGLTEVTAGDLPQVLEAMADYDAVTSFELLQRWEDTALVQFGTDDALLLAPIQGSKIPLEMPFVLTDGTAAWEITAPQERLSALGEQLDSFGIPFTVDRITQQVDSEQLLTERQLALVRTAVEEGYYDTPRECSLTELADAVGIAKSTCSETLHRAEETIIKQFVADLAERPTTAPAGQ